MCKEFASYDAPAVLALDYQQCSSFALPVGIVADI